MISKNNKAYGAENKRGQRRRKTANYNSNVQSLEKNTGSDLY